MFKTYDMTGFGKYIRGVRKSLNLTQKDVESMIGLNCETLRRIETGLVIPRYDTIEFLAKVYKTDVLSAFSEYRVCYELYEFYGYLDKIIIENNKEKINTLLDDFDLEIKEETKLHLLNQSEIVQLRSLIQGLDAYYCQECFSLCMTFCIEALQLSIKDFSINDIKSYYLSKLEIRIVILLSLCLSHFKKWEEANKLLEQCFDIQKYSARLSKCEVCILIKIHFNVSYNYFNLEKDKKSLAHAKAGLTYCLDHDLFYMMPNLLYREGIAKYHLKNPDYKKPLQNAVNILIATGQEEQARLYQNVTKENYDIHLEMINH